MAVIFMDGFDHQYTDGEAPGMGYTGNFPSGTAVGERYTAYPGRCVSTTDGTSYLKKVDGITSSANMTVGIAWKMRSDDSFTATQFGIYASDNSSLNARINLTSIGALILKDRNNNIIETSTVFAHRYTWHYWELSVYSHPTAGTIQFWQDGILVFDYVAGNQNTGDGNNNGAYIIHEDNYNLDDFYITNDLVRLDQPIIFTLFPTGNGTDTDWAGDVTYVDDTGSVPTATKDSTSVASSTSTERESFTYPDLPTGSWNIHAVQPTVRYNKLSTGTPELAVECGTGATETNIQVGNTDYKFTTKSHEFSDGVSTPWDETDFSTGLEITLEHI